MKKSLIKGQFIESRAGNIFVLLHKPVARAGKQPCVLVVPPLAEEMNKARRVFSDFAVDAAGRGLACALVDLYGTGDSEGEFGDSRWQTWEEDVLNTIQWIERQDMLPNRLLGLRLGCLLAASTTRRFRLRFEQCVFWQPVLKGSTALSQLLRLRIAASMMEGAERESMADIQARLASGESVEAAGYLINPTLASELKALDLLRLVTPDLGQLGMFEICRKRDESPGRASRALIEGAAKSGVDICCRQISGEPFWSSAEVVRNKQLAELTADALVPRS